MRIQIKTKGNYNHLEGFFNKIKYKHDVNILRKYGEVGVQALQAATPRLTGKTAESWYYKVTEGTNRLVLSFCNSNINNGVPIAIILQYGHATGSGGWVEGRDYINPALTPIFDKIVKEMWEEMII